MKQLTKSKNNRMISGVIGGLAEYLEVDVSALRVAWVVAVVLTGFVPLTIVYLVAMLIIPESSDHDV